MPSEGSRANAAIWVVAALLAVFAVVRLTGLLEPGGGGAPVRIDRSPAARSPPATRRRSTCTLRERSGSQGSLKLPSGSRVATAVQRAGGPGHAPTSPA